MNIVNPTGNELHIRNDGWGSGAFGTPRGDMADGSKKYHDGIDLVVVPGQEIYSMIDGMVEKLEQPYLKDASWQGIQIANKILRVEIWYMLPYADLPGRFIEAGTQVGYAQDISQKYGKHPEKGVMTPHIHVRVTMRAFSQIANNKYISFDTYVDPYVLLPGV